MTPKLPSRDAVRDTDSLTDKREVDNLYPLPSAHDESGITVVTLSPSTPVKDYREAMQLADAEARARMNEYMLLSWYDRDFEAPQHVSECHQATAVPGYVDYGIHHGATLKVDVQQGRFVFFLPPGRFLDANPQRSSVE